LATIRGLDAGSGAAAGKLGSVGAIIAPSNAAYNTLGSFISGFEELSSFRSVAPVDVPASLLESAATAKGAVSEKRQAVRRTAIDDRTAERCIRFSISHL
jgi:hypothetical protein